MYTHMHAYILIIFFLYKIKALKEVLQLIEKSQTIQGHKIGEKQTDILLTLYEFEAKALMGLEGLEDLLEKLSRIPSVEPKTFEIAAGFVDVILNCF